MHLYARTEDPQRCGNGAYPGDNEFIHLGAVNEPTVDEGADYSPPETADREMTLH